MSEASVLTPTHLARGRERALGLTMYLEALGRHDPAMRIAGGVAFCLSAELSRPQRDLLADSYYPIDTEGVRGTVVCDLPEPLP